MWKWTLSALLALAGAEEAPAPVRIHVAATKGHVIPQARGGGGFQRSFRFTAKPGKANRWIRQALEVRGTVFDAKGKTKAVHLDVIEYYRVAASGRAIQLDSHYSQFWKARGGALRMRSTLTYGALKTVKRGDTIIGKSFILRSATDAAGKPVTMKTRTTRQVIPAEFGKRVRFERDPGSIPTHYTYGVQWDARVSRTKPAGAVETGTWRIEAPKQTGRTVARSRERPIPVIEAKG